MKRRLVFSLQGQIAGRDAPHNKVYECKIAVQQVGLIQDVPESRAKHCSFVFKYKDLPVYPATIINAGRKRFEVVWQRKDFRLGGRTRH